MVRGAWVTLAVRAGCVLGVFDALDQPRSVAELAGLSATDPASLRRFLAALTDLELLERREGEVFCNTALGATLRTDHPSQLRTLVLMQGTVPNLTAWSALDDALRTGSGVFERVNAVSMWEHLAREPETQRVFNASMARRAGSQVDAVLAAVDLSGVSSLVDVGGGRGAMVSGLLEAVPTLHGTVADRPAVVQEAASAFAASGLGDRAEAAGCDFFESVPAGADVYTIANVLHDWDDADCVSILRTVRQAMPDGSRLLVVEHVLDAPGRSFEDARDLHFVDLHMLVVFGARERSHAEYDALLTEAGFEPSRLAPAASEWNVLESRPAT
jgi:hypothetical protein